MAEGRRMTRSVIGSSDVIYDFSCTPCAEDEKNTEAVSYCVNCDTYFCQTCVGHHDKVFKSHSQLDKTALTNVGQKQEQPKTAIKFPNSECVEHPGKIIQMYCGSHNVVCCTICTAMEHRSCNGIEFIPKLAKGIMKSTERQVAKTALEKIRREVLQFKAEKTKETADLTKMKGAILDEITKLKSRLIERVDEMERKGKEDITAKYKEIVENIENDIDSLNTMLRSTEIQIKAVHDDQSNESDIFVTVKGSQKLESSYKTLLQQVKGETSAILSLEYNDDVKYFLDKVYTFGTIPTIDDSSFPYSATLDGEFNIKVNDDENVCRVFDICQLDNDKFIISDFRNDKIKMLDQTFCVIDSCKLSEPWGICKTRKDELAVTLCDKEEVQFVKLDTKLACTRSFKTDIPCRGITCIYNDDKLIISCGKKKQSGEVRVYNLSGFLLRTHKNDKTGNPMFSFITHLAFTSNGSKIYICDEQNGLIGLDMQGNKLSLVSDQKLKYTVDVCFGNHNEIFLCGFVSNNVLQLDKHDSIIKELLTQSDGIVNPVTVTLLRCPKRLVITCFEANTLKVFKLS